MDSRTLLLLADAVLILHLAVAGFIVLGLPLTWIGHWRGWRFVHSPWLRLPHLGAMALVLAEDLLGRHCPLTEWEWALRQAALGQGPPRQSWAAAWAGRMLYADLPDWAFTALYAGFFGLAAFTAWAVPIRMRTPR
ncbi:MAG: DUF2784 domain-containing protein [Thermodesulfobacteriota bacterium]